MKLLAVLLALFPALAFAGPNILSNTDHAEGELQTSLTILGAAATTVDQTCPTGGAGYNAGSTCGASNSFVFPPFIFINSYALNASQGEYTGGTATPANHAPYKLITESSTGWGLAGYDQTNYEALEANGVQFTTAYCGTPQQYDYPPVAVSNVLLNTAPAGAIGTSSCGYATGVEFSMTNGYLGFPNGSPSATNAAMAAIFEVMAQNHPTWTWGDIKGALRQTASNWATGYTAYNATGPAFGFGNVNYTAANAVASTSAIYLQGPGMTVQNETSYAKITLYPFLTTRRSKEVIYSVASSYVWPVKNEYTTADITASGATLLYTSNGMDAQPVFNYAPALSGTYTFVAFTTDGAGNYSRVESYSELSAALTPQTECYR